jgi:DNA primase
MNVEELLIKQKIPFIPSGKDFLVSCLNPDHDDSNPSMRIDKVIGIFQCLSCGYKGNIFYKFGQKPNKMDIMRENLKRKIQEIRQGSIFLKT